MSVEDKIKTKEEVKNYMEEHIDHTFVFTNGCFDLLHVGHVNYLDRARNLGDCLIIGMNSNESVRKLKGEKRPILDEKDRAYILSGLASVSFVIIFSEETPMELIRYLQPHIHVKGGDYSIQDLPEASVVKQYGGNIKILPFQEGKSTTNILNIILDRYT